MTYYYDNTRLAYISASDIIHESRLENCRAELLSTLYDDRNVVQNEQIRPSASFLSELKKVTAKARELLRESSQVIRQLLPYKNLERVVLTAEAALDKLWARVDQWRRANVVLDQQRDLLTRLQNGSTGYQRDLVDLNGALAKLEEIRCFMTSNGDKHRLRYVMEKVEKKRDEIKQDLVTGMRKEQTRRSQVIDGKPAIEILEQIKRQELRELTEKYNFITHHCAPSEIPTELHGILNKLEKQLDETLQQASVKEPAVLAVNTQHNDGPPILQLDIVKTIKTSDTTEDAAAPKFFEKQIKMLESALLRLRSKSKEVNERGRGKEEERTEERQQVHDCSMDPNDPLRIRITELEQAIVREVLRAEEERQDEEENDQIRLARLLLACLNKQPLLSRAKRT